jgi:sulfur-oxidizing protein SoxY
VNFSISENPNFRFYFLPRANGELKAQVEDTKNKQFESEIAISTASGPPASPAPPGPQQTSSVK